MGAGKTSAAATVSAALGLEARDTDREIERELGESIAAHFESAGEASFRRIEEAVTLRLIDDPDIQVLALGGGAVESAVIRDALANRAYVVWCEVDEPTAWQRCSRSNRPLATSRDEFRRRFEARTPLYESLADAVLPQLPAADRRASAAWLDHARTVPGARLTWGRSASGSYPALYCRGALDALGLTGSGRVFAVADRVVVDAWPGITGAAGETVEVEASEERKTLAEAERVLRALAGVGMRRDDRVLALGGGVVGDLAGFCAATYQRGVPVVQAPTTVVAQVDSALGGKTGVDLPEGKNYVGAYHLPSAVLSDPGVLATLPREEIAAGYAEVIKTALIAGGELWQTVRGMGPLGSGEAATQLNDLTFLCARTKLGVVAEDERDGGRRQVLNLGHTVGHAIEAVTSYGRYRHGEAISLGLLAALRLSGAEGLRAECEALLSAQGLPVRLDPSIDPESVVDATARDKKALAAGVGFVLLERPGEPRIGQTVDRTSLLGAVRELREE
ncbi:bifunctional shikimate kinase/3-dehydroquinate synthase [Thermoleophilia bacterium SCSIO 60948]|nr:bifunctional shikimate kinase/3-dehydroquinate synthase [Thermoleophilia bacterium SCSIO 60948]